MSQHSISLSLTELVSKLNEGGWIVSGGRQTRELGFQLKLPVIKALLLEKTLKIETRNRSFEVPNDNIFIIDSWIVEVRHTFMLNQQRKKIEGGGWREVPTVGVALRMSNPEIERLYREAEKAKERRACEARQQANRRRRTTEIQQFLASISEQFVGEKINAFQFLDWNEEVGPALIVMFEGGKTMSFKFEMNDCEGGCCCATAEVNGTSLRFAPEGVN